MGEFGENVGNKKMEREWELMVMKWGEIVGNKEGNSYEELCEEVGNLKV